MQLFSKYLDGISEIASRKKKNFSSITHSKRFPKYIEKGIVNEALELDKTNNNNKILIEFDKSELASFFGPNQFSFSENIIGTHPDFKDIKYHEFQNHYCVSMFCDIKGSTRLNERYTLLEIRQLKDTILTLAIHLASHFGGHVHRLQGDGIFLQFVRKDQKVEDAVINALNAASLLTHFVSNDLAQILKDNQTEPLRIRTGIDLGFDKDVIWSHYGIPGCSELTTTSLHTDLAAKLQAKAKSNGIMVGGNIKNLLDLKPAFCENVFDNEGKVDYYIYKGKIHYRKFNFNWINYLNSFGFTQLNSSRNGVEINSYKLTIKCRISDSNHLNGREYYQNSIAIEKGYNIKYSLMENNHLYFKKSYESIEWTAHNFGQEAAKANLLNHDFGGAYKNKVECHTTAGFKGHHYVKCKIKSSNSYTPNQNIIFPIFVT